MAEASLSNWVCREVLLRRDALSDALEGGKETSKSKKAWDEIGTLAMIRFGSSFNLEEIKTIWEKDGPTFIENLTVKEEQTSPVSSTSRQEHAFEDLLTVKLEDLEEDDDAVTPNKRRRISDPISRGNPPCHAYKVIVREVLKRSSLLIDKSNSKSRTPQANHARWSAWQEIKAVVTKECQREMPVEQIQIIWRHQKQKIPPEMVEKAIMNPTIINDRVVDNFFKYYDDKERWSFDFTKTENTDITTVLKDMIPAAEINLGRDRELYDKNSLPPTLQIQPSNIQQLLTPIISITKPPAISPPAEPEPSSVSQTSIEDSIDTVIRNSAEFETPLLDRRVLLNNLIKAHTTFLEQTVSLHARQMEVLEKFNKTVERLLEDYQ